jgi:hypothetical protein
MAVMHMAPHAGGSAKHWPSALHEKATSLFMPHPISVQVGLHGSPQARPSHGSAAPQVGHVVVHWPMRQRDVGHDVVPSGHIWQGAPMSGHSASLMHCVGHVGYVTTQRPI